MYCIFINHKVNNSVNVCLVEVYSMQNVRGLCDVDPEAGQGIIKLKGLNSSTTDTVTIVLKAVSIQQLSERLCFTVIASNSSHQVVIKGTLYTRMSTGSGICSIHLLSVLSCIHEHIQYTWYTQFSYILHEIFLHLLGKPEQENLQLPLIVSITSLALLIVIGFSFGGVLIVILFVSTRAKIKVIRHLESEILRENNETVTYEQIDETRIQRSMQNQETVVHTAENIAYEHIKTRQ